MKVTTIAMITTALLAAASALAADEPPDRPTVEVLFATKVQDRQPVAPDTTFAPGKVYCWNKLTSRESHYLIAHHWVKNGRRVYRQPIQIRGRRWVTWSYFKVTPGSWTVRVTDESGMEIQSASFTVE
jgi:hypothetical protein